MITKEQIDNLKCGDKLIFSRHGGVLSTDIGNVFTFSNWLEENDKYRPSKLFWQCIELHKQGNHSHNFIIRDVELFDENIHKDFVIMDEKKLIDNLNKFNKEYGD